MKSRMKHPVRILLWDVRSAENVGSIIRTADAAGAEEVCCAGITPGITDRFGRVNSKVTKASLGAERSVRVTSAPHPARAVRALARKGWRIVAVEQAERSVPYSSYALAAPTVLVMGNEVDGLPPEALKLADAVVEIPMSGEKESLNVSVALGVVLFALRDGSGARRRSARSARPRPSS